MKYILTILLTGFIALSFINHKCEHVFTQIEQAAIKIERPGLYGSMTLTYNWPSGTQEGKDLICVKCFHQAKQVLDYGSPAGRTFTMPGQYNIIDTLTASFQKIDMNDSICKLLSVRVDSSGGYIHLCYP